MAVIGDNGTGKTTLLKIINQMLPADSGEIILGTRVHIGYYDQDHQVLHMEKTLFDELQDAYPTLNNTRIRSVLAAFLFTGDDVFKRIGDLSGGERGRVSLAKLMLSNANFLILDEPTNHLDITSKEILEHALNQYTGTVLYVSHDRYFINRTATRILELTGETFINYIGNYDYYLEKRELMNDLYAVRSQDNIGKNAPGNGAGPGGARSAGTAYSTGDISSEGGSQGAKGRTPLLSGAVGSSAVSPSAMALTSAGPSSGKPEVRDVKQDWKAQKEEQALQRKKQNALKKTEEEIASLEERDSALDQQLSRPEIASDVGKLMEIHKEKEAVRERLEELYEVWETLAEDV